jgi:chromosome segregation ATPase
MADSVLTSLNRDLERWEADIARAREEIKRIETKRRSENVLWDRDVDTQERKITSAETRRQDIKRQIESRNRELERASEAANKNSAPQKKASGFW